MFEQLFCHIGAHKTGTSSIQGTFWRNRKALEAAGVFHVRQPSAFLAAVSDTPGQLVPIRNRRLAGDRLATFVDTMRRKLGEAALAGAHSRAVLSTEHALTLTPDEVARLAALLQGHARHVRVIYYARHPYGRLPSYLSQEIKTGHATLATALDRYVEDYEAVLAPWIAAFGRDNMIVRAYEVADMPDASVVADICAAMGVPELYGEMEIYRRNEGISAAATLIANALNANGQAGSGREPLIALLEGIAGPKLTVAPEALAALEGRIAGGLGYLRREFGITLRAPALPPHVTDRNAIFSDEVVASLAALLLDTTARADVLRAQVRDKDKRLERRRAQKAGGDV